MRILFLNPPFKTEFGRYSRSSRSPAITKSGTIYYPVWLCYAAGVLEEAGHEVKIIDSCACGYTLDETLSRVKAFSPEMAVIDTSTPSIYSDIETCRAIKGIMQQCFTVIMGTHPTALPEETLKLASPVDAAVLGEAEYTLKELVSRLVNRGLSGLREHESKVQLLGPVDGLAFRAGERVIVNKRRRLIQDLDSLPFVSEVYKRHLDIKKYFFAASDYPEVQIMTSRGCVARCSYCVYPQTMHGGKYRMRSANSIIREFKWIKENMPEVREVGIEDDTFTGDQERVIEFCRGLADAGIGLKWYCNVRVDLKYETMLWMKKAGCALVTVGYESASKNVLVNIGKKAAPERAYEFSKNARKAGLLVHGCFMAGNRGDTRETLEKSLRMALMLNDDTMQFFPLIVYPGTEDYELLSKSGHITEGDYASYLTEDGNHNSVSKTQDMTSDELREWCDYARRRYYLRPGYIFYKTIQQARHPAEARRTFRAATRFLKFLVGKGKKGNKVRR